MPYEVVFLRHGQSEWNRDNRFTGWTDIDLTDQGRKEARRAAELIKAEGYGELDVAFTSVLTRAIRSLWIVLDGLNRQWIPVHRSWRLNERHYGSLQGLNKAETAAQHGQQQVLTWRRSFSTPPPALAPDDDRHPSRDPKYGAIDPKVLPLTEALSHCIERVVPYWVDQIAPAIRSGQRVIVCAHGNSLRALVKYLDEVPDDKIVQLNIPTGRPLIYSLDANLRPTGRRYLGDPAEIAAEQQAVADQAQSTS